MNEPPAVGMGRAGVKPQDDRGVRPADKQGLPGFGQRTPSVMRSEALGRGELDVQDVPHAASLARFSRVSTQASAASAPFFRKWAWKKS